MRKQALSLLFITGAAMPVAAQQITPWKPEIGIRFNYTKSTINDQDITTFGAPGTTNVAGIGGVGGLYGIIPVGERWAIEPSIGVSDLAITTPSSGQGLTGANFGARVLFSAFGPVYVAAGPTMTFFRYSGTQQSVWGGQAAVGYHRQLNGSLRARAEVYYEKQGEIEILGNEKAESWGVTLGLGFTPSAAAGRRADQSDRMWRPMIGLQGGFSHLTSESGVDINGFSLPGGQGSVTYLGSALPLPGLIPFFAQFPLGARVAVEPSVGFGSLEVEGSGKVSTTAVGVRVNYAFTRALYAGVSGDYLTYGGDLDIDATSGFGVQGGVRFPLVSGLMGRTEFSYRKLDGDESAFIGKHSVTGVAFALMAPLN